MLFLSITLHKICKPFLKIKPQLFESGFARSKLSIVWFQCDLPNWPLSPHYNTLLSLKARWLTHGFKFFFNVRIIP